jgi:hypothetical protein
MRDVLSRNRRRMNNRSLFNLGGTGHDQEGMGMRIKTSVFSVFMVAIVLWCGTSCNNSANGDGGTLPAGDAQIIFLHHSTGENIWNGGVPQNIPQYQIVEQWFPENYGNDPYDYWNLWVNRGDEGELTLETLTDHYQMIIFKHCFPVGEIGEDIGEPDVTSSDKRLENYYLQYNALRAKLHEFPNTRFIVWTGAALVQDATDAEMATRTWTFFTWVKNTWDQRNDNIFIWDFYELETEGGLYMRDGYASGADDSHPNEAFAQRVAPLLARRIVNVLEGRGDSTSLTGE